MHGGGVMADLYNITTPFGLLDEATRKMLMKADAEGKKIEAYIHGSWEGLYPVWIDHLVYRLARATQDTVPWDVIDDNFISYARDRDGECKVYTGCPTTEKCGPPFWQPGSDFARIDGLLVGHSVGGCDWKDSLQFRPGYKPEATQ